VKRALALEENVTWEQLDMVSEVEVAAQYQVCSLHTEYFSIWGRPTCLPSECYTSDYSIYFQTHTALNVELFPVLAAIS